MRNVPDIVAAITPLIDAFEQLEVTYYIGGSVASSVYGLPRLTIDADIVANIQQKHVRPLVKLLENEYYIDADMIRDALKYHSSFNVIHNDTVLKVDIFIPKLRPFDQEELHHIQHEDILGSTRKFYLSSPEDVVLNKLEWYKMGGGVSDRQWNDILGVLKVQGPNIDMAYLRKWAVTLDVADLLEQAFVDAGLTTL